jgi:hypothetical protein
MDLPEITTKTVHSVDLFDCPSKVQTYLQDVYTPANDSQFCVSLDYDPDTDDPDWAEFCWAMSTKYPSVSELTVEVCW